MTEKSFTEILSDLAISKNRQSAITCGADKVTFGELDRMTNRLARAYAKLGVNENDFVTIALPNSVEFISSCIAIWKLGATPQPVSPKLPAKELRAIINLAKSTLVVGRVCEGLEGVNHIPCGYVSDKSLSDSPLPEKISRYWKAPTSGGSTGLPKLIVSEFTAMFDPDSPSFIHQPNDSVVIIPGPLYHNGPFICALEAIWRGNHIIVMPKFDELEFLKLTELYSAQWTVLVPTMMQRIWRLPEQDRKRYQPDSLRTVLHFASSCPIWLKEKWIHWLGAEKILELYGGTEGHGRTWINGAEWLQNKGSVGRCEEGFKLMIVDDNGHCCGPGETGQIFFLPEAGQGSTYHYVGAEPDAIAGGWETLGDIGYLDKDGYLYLCDRKKDLIISGGVNIYPAEVEAAIESHPSVRSAVVVGVADEDLGQKVHAFVDAPLPVTEGELVDYLTDSLVRYKIPRSFLFLSKPLRDDAGKVRRSDLASQLKQKNLGCSLIEIK